MSKKLMIVLMLALAFVLAFSTAAFAEYVKGFDKNLELYPDWIGVDGQGLPTTQPIFNYTASGYIDEIVWVEVPVDTDRDGKRDRVSLWIRRPVTKEGFLCPVVMEFSPYHHGTRGYGRMNNYINSEDDHLRALAETFRYHDNYPVSLAINPNTTHLTYDDIKYKGTEAWDPIWWSGDAPFKVNSWYTGVPYGSVPAATVPTGVGKAESFTWGINGGSGIPARWTHYFVRGYAMVFGQLLGNRMSEGIPNTMHIEEWISAAAAAKWFNGEARAFTTRDGSIEVLADWANGHIGMDGTSYPGTTPLIAAMAGVSGLKAIMPESCPSSQYDYYRSGGSLHCPDGYGGEDINLHSSFNFSRIDADLTGNANTLNNVIPPDGPNFPMVAQKAYIETQQYMMKEQDRVTGDYNAEWDVRNMTRGYGHIPADVGILHTNGQQDWNVMPRHAYEVMQAMRDRFEGNYKLVSGLSAHASQSGRLVMGKDGVERGMLKWYLMFLDHYLLGLDNKVEELMYDINIANNITGVMEGYDFDTAKEERGTIMPGTYFQKIYLTPGPAGKAGRLSYNVPAATVQHFADMDIHAQFTAPLHLGVNGTGGTANRPNNTVGTISGQGNRMITAAQGQWCEDRLIGVHRTFNLSADAILGAVDQPIEGRLLYLSEPLTERLVLSGSPVVYLKAAPDRGMGNLSVALLDIGRTARVGARTGTSGVGGASTVVFPLENGAAVSNAANYTNPASTTQYNFKYVTWGHTDVQNPCYDDKAWFDLPERNYIPDYYFQTTKLEPGKYYDYMVELNPYNHTFEVGTRLAIMVYGTDPLYSPLLTPECSAEFDVQLGAGSYAMIPLRLAEPQAPVTIAVESKLVAPGDTVEIAYSIADNDLGFSKLNLKLPFDSSLYTPIDIVPVGLLNNTIIFSVIDGDMLDISMEADDNIIGDGQLFTVIYKVADNAPTVFSAPLDVIVKKAIFDSFMDKTVDVDVVVKAGALTPYNFNVYVKAGQASYKTGETVLVDVMLGGNLNFTQVIASIAYDADVLEYAGYANLTGLAAEIKKTSDGTISLRSVPSLNMLLGASCLAPVRLVTLQFAIKDTAEDIAAAVGIAARAVTPTASAGGYTISPGKTVDIHIGEIPIIGE